MPPIPDFSKARVLVVGDVMLDCYWHGSTRRISPEAPVPVVNVNEREERPGGAANVALNIAALGAHASLLGIVGKDEAAQTLVRMLTASSVVCHFVELEGIPTITKLRVISRHQQLIRLDFEEELLVDEIEDFEGAYGRLLSDHDIVVLCDYAKGTLKNVQSLITLARAAGKIVLVDPKLANAGVYRGATLISPNLSELEAMVGGCPNETALLEKGQKLVGELDLEGLLVTLGEHGMTLLRPGKVPQHLPSHAREVHDVTGAGDTVIATTAAAIGAGLDLGQAVTLANFAAGIVVSKLGTAAIGWRELQRQVRADAMRPGVVGEEELLLAIQDARARGKRIVMTNGCFDILHIGHVTYLERARSMGDRLVVAVNTDASVRDVKGPNRPVNPLEARMAVLAALSFVDWVVPFAESTPERLICRVLPDVLVKGNDYRPEEIAGAECVLKAGGEVRTVELVEGVSTTSILSAKNAKYT